MKFFICILLFSLTLVNSFHSSIYRLQCKSYRLHNRLRLSENVAEAQKYDLIPVNKANSESAAAVSGGVLGFVFGGPVVAAIFAAVANYVAKKDNDSGEALRGAGKTVVETINFLKKLNAKYNLVSRFTSSLNNAISSAAKDNEAIEKVKESLSSTASKVSELNQEYQLVDKGKDFVAAAATLSDTAIEKVIELNGKYGLVEKATEVANNVLEKIRDNVKNSK